MFSGIFSTVSNIFNGKITFDNITDSIKNKFKEFINKLISGLNSILSKVVSPINTIIRKLKNFEIFGAKPFYWSLWEISTPSIPYLAKGAVIPPNAPFMAVLGDQRHGTNIEAPLSTIQEAVALVMEDMIQSNLSGHEATVAVLQQILEAVLGIELDGSTISRVVNNYNRKMAVVKGGL
jgi:phage-related protein